MVVKTFAVSAPIQARVAQSSSEPELAGLEEVSLTHLTVTGSMAKPQGLNRHFSIENFELSKQAQTQVKKELADRRFVVVNEPRQASTRSRTTM